MATERHGPLDEPTSTPWGRPLRAPANGSSGGAAEGAVGERRSRRPVGIGQPIPRATCCPRHRTCGSPTDGRGRSSSTWNARNLPGPPRVFGFHMEQVMRRLRASGCNPRCRRRRARGSFRVPRGTIYLGSRDRPAGGSTWNRTTTASSARYFALGREPGRLWGNEPAP